MSMGIIGVDALTAKIEELKTLGVKLQNDFDFYALNIDTIRANPQLSSMYDSIRSQWESVKGTISSVVSAVQGGVDWFKTTFGLNGIDMVETVNRRYAPVNLGILPAIPIGTGLTLAAVAAAVAAVQYFDGQTQQFRDQLSADLVKQGKQPLANAPTLTGNIASIAQWLAIGALVIFVLPKLLKR